MLLGITGHRGILAKSIIKYIKKNNKNNYKISLYQHDILDYQKLEQWLKRVDIARPWPLTFNKIELDKFKESNRTNRYIQESDDEDEDVDEDVS